MDRYYNFKEWQCRTIGLHLTTAVFGKHPYYVVLYTPETQKFCKRIGVKLTFIEPGEEDVVGHHIVHPYRPAKVLLDDLCQRMSQIEFEIHLFFVCTAPYDQQPTHNQMLTTYKAAKEIGAWDDTMLQRIITLRTEFGDSLVKVPPATDVEYFHLARKKMFAKLDEFAAQDYLFEVQYVFPDNEARARALDEILFPVQAATDYEPSWHELHQKMESIELKSFRNNSNSFPLESCYPFFVGTGQPGRTDGHDYKALQILAEQMTGSLIGEDRKAIVMNSLQILTMGCPIGKLFNVCYPKSSKAVDYGGGLYSVRNKQYLVLLHHMLMVDMVLLYHSQQDSQINLPNMHLVLNECFRTNLSQPSLYQLYHVMVPPLLN